jgi:hypothetical protein
LIAVVAAAAVKVEEATWPWRLRLSEVVSEVVGEVVVVTVGEEEVEVVVRIAVAVSGMS